MCLLVLKCALLCVLMAGSVCACVLKNHTIWVERQNCTQCVAISTTICSGYCYTRDTILRGRLGRIFLIQRGCMPLSLEYRVALIPGCRHDVNQQLHYPAAQSCSCKHCDTRAHHCVHARRFSYDRCSLTFGTVDNPNRTCFENMTTC